MAKTPGVLNTTEHITSGEEMLNRCKYGDLGMIRRLGRKRVKLATALFQREVLSCENHMNL